jgi:small-conductance mechanosensitive channel
MSDSYQEILAALGHLWKHKLLTIAGIKLSLGNVTVAITLLLFATRLSRLVVKIITKRIIVKFVEEKNVQVTYQTFTFYACLAGFVCLSLTVAGIPLTVFTVVGGALAIGVGFGSQNIVNNFISGIIMLVEQPVRVGDVVDVDGTTGSIISIGTRSTKIKNADNKVFIVPNSFFLEKSVMNWSYDTPILKNTVNFGVAYGSDVRLLEKICLDIMKDETDIENSPVPQVLFQDFGDNNLNFSLIFHCNLDKVSSLPEVRSKVRFQVDEKFRQNKIEMAFPQRDLNFKFNRPIDVKVLS